MNYSATERYWDDCKAFEKKAVSRDRIKKRWFRNHYVLYQHKGYFTHNTFVMEFGKFDPNEYSGDYYGPFSESDATRFAGQVKNVHESFILG